jgi:hypothetical protein
MHQFPGLVSDSPCEGKSKQGDEINCQVFRPGFAVGRIWSLDFSKAECSQTYCTQQEAVWKRLTEQKSYPHVDGKKTKSSCVHEKRKGEGTEDTGKRELKRKLEGDGGTGGQGQSS